MDRLSAFIPVLLLTAVIHAGCDNTLEINGGYQERVIVYGLLDHGADTQYIRIQKSFLGENTSALELAGQAGENYYLPEELTVYLWRWQDGVRTDSIPLEYVDGDTLGIDKPEGLFASTPNILYRTTATIDTLSDYQLMAIHHASGDTISAYTRIVWSYYLYFPTRPDTYIDFADTGRITFTCKQAVHAKLYDLNLTFRYAEKNTVTGDSTIHALTWNIFSNKSGTNTEGYSNIAYSMERYSFFTFLAATLEPDTQVVRYALDLQFDWYAGGMELYDQYLNMLANLGINQDYISPEYTNVDGGIGIFSSRHKESAGNIRLGDATLDSLACGVITRPLGFVSAASNPDYPGCGL